MNGDAVIRQAYATEIATEPQSSSGGMAIFFVWRVCAWAGPFFMLGFFVFWAVTAHFFPPPAENWSTAQVVAFFTQNQLRIMIGMVGLLFTAPTYFVWSAVISRVMERISGRESILPSIELMGGVTTAVVSQFLALPWLAASFRIETRSPQDIQLMYDLGWLIFNSTFAVTSLQFTAFGFAILLDKRSDPLFPKWLGWFTFAAEATFLPVLLMVFLPNGPFAWDGLLSFYVALAGFFSWQVLVCYYLFGAITKVENEARLGYAIP